ncbi:MAG: hypothetical protein ABMA14_10350 [Hyphomonadaceae bacterium]
MERRVSLSVMVAGVVGLGLPTVASCASPEEPREGEITAIYHYPAPDGRTTWQIHCYGWDGNQDICERRAYWLCRHDYEVVGREVGRLTVDPAPPGVFEETLTVICKPDRPPSK